MPLGIERINVRRRSPNPLINFLTPLKTPDEAISRDYLERIAAIVYPIMKAHGLAVMTLDEFPANREFWGRNFNAGENIQLVLKHPHNGQWLPFRFVQGVMIHELAHIKQMNHSRAFWAVRNGYAAELAALHARGYTGEGFWSTGRNLLSEQFTQDRVLAEDGAPEAVCGGTYRSRARRRRKVGGEERKRRRVEKRFGSAEGVKVGTDEEERRRLVGGNQAARPRVANSKRGRELRAAAALKRFEIQKEETESEGEEEEEEEEEGENVGGGKMLVPVSRGEDGREAKEEMKRELELLGGCCGTGLEFAPIVLDDEEECPAPSQKNTRPSTKNPPPDEEETSLRPTDKDTRPPPKTTSTHKSQPPKDPPSTICAVCTTSNPRTAPICETCNNVLDPTTHGSWKCSTVTCAPCYRNPLDAALCGVCGAPR